VTVPPPDRLTMMPLVMAALLSDGARPTGDPDAVGTARIVADATGRVAGLAVAKEAFGRMGARCRPLADEGAAVEAGTSIAELGGPLGAIRAAAPTALRLLVRLSSIAAGTERPDPADPLDAWAGELARLSPPGPVGDDSPSFHLEIEG
jgi:nicotinate-nucleotide pyrophosphorylase